MAVSGKQDTETVEQIRKNSDLFQKQFEILARYTDLCNFLGFPEIPAKSGEILIGKSPFLVKLNIISKFFFFYSG